jgi:leader peptidase (prepilin peptidase)/N-methyltransferase
MTPETWSPVTGLVMAAVGAVLGWFLPRLIARIPEPEPGPDPAVSGPEATEGPAGGAEDDVTVDGHAPAQKTGVETGVEAEGPKERYVAIAALPGLAPRSAATAAVAAGLVGAVVGWDPVLAVWAYLVPVGVALAVVDWRTRLLPTRVIAPSYAVLLLLTLLAALVSGDGDSLLRAGWGWLVAGGTFFALWFLYPRGMGYGDVRLSGLLGICLGYLGWAELLTGVYAGFVLGGVGGLLLSFLRIVDRRSYPFGPFMLVGALVGVLLGPGVAAWYA